MIDKFKWLIKVQIAKPKRLRPNRFENNWTYIFKLCVEIYKNFYEARSNNLFFFSVLEILKAYFDDFSVIL